MMGMIQAPDQARIDRLDQMVQRYEKDLLRICCLYLRDWSAAEDIVQDTFLKAYKNLDSFRGDSSEKTWLIKIALNGCRDYRRSAWYRYIDFHVSVRNGRFFSVSEEQFSRRVRCTVRPAGKFRRDRVRIEIARNKDRLRGALSQVGDHAAAAALDARLPAVPLVL